MNELTKALKNPYNKGDPKKCECGRVVAFRKDNKIYVKCKECRKWIAILSIDEVKAQ